MGDVPNPWNGAVPKAPASPVPFVPPPGSVQVATTPPGQVTVSPAGSFAGFSLKTLLVRNKSAVKLFGAGLAGYLAFLASVIKDPQLNALAAGGVVLLAKLGLDWLDFWLTDVVISPTKDGA